MMFLSKNQEQMLKNITEGSVIEGGSIVHLSKDFTAFDYFISRKEMEIDLNPRTATGQSLRNLCAYKGVSVPCNCTDEEARTLYFARRKGYQIIIADPDGYADIVFDLDVNFENKSGEEAVLYVKSICGFENPVLVSCVNKYYD